MTAVFLCTIGFIILLFSDLLQVWKKEISAKILAPPGYLMITGGMIILISSFSPVPRPPIIFATQIILAVLFALLLIYSVLVEIPLYSRKSESSKRKAIKSGTYSFVRHPGFLWFLLLHLLLISIYRNRWFTLNSLFMVLLDFILVFLEDRFFFPKIFPNYREYMKNVPFLIPNRIFMTKKRDASEDE
jgi:protein-S-isoprenylcysteine O-methyltransferase Ste14